MTTMLLALIAILVLSPLLPAPRRPPEAILPTTPEDPAFRARLARIGGHQ
jgi:hypothetical protein